MPGAFFRGFQQQQQERRRNHCCGKKGNPLGIMILWLLQAVSKTCPSSISAGYRFGVYRLRTEGFLEEFGSLMEQAVTPRQLFFFSCEIHERCAVPRDPFHS
jgi:hypothetical protein